MQTTGFHMILPAAVVQLPKKITEDFLLYGTLHGTTTRLDSHMITTTTFVIDREIVKEKKKLRCLQYHPYYEAFII